MSAPAPINELSALYTMQADLYVKLAALPALDVSDQGRSVSATSARAAIIEQLKWVSERIVQVTGPFEIQSRRRS